jgi:hypothetical protein
MPLLRHVSLLAATVAFACGAADAQFVNSHNSSADSPVASSESSSNANAFVADDDASSSADAMPGDPSPSGAAAGQENGGYGRHGGGFHSLGSRLTFDLGAGFNGPIGNDNPYITWGGNFTLGGGLRLSHGISVLGEYQFIDNKLPGAFIAAGGGTTGNAHINSITVDPVIDLFPKWKNSFYAVGGAGWYHKSTNFNVQECCDFFGYPVTVTANSFSSDQLGANIGLGFEHRMGGMYGDSKTKLFAEARYTYIHTPPITQTNGLGTTELIPVTFGVRF